MIHHFSLVNVMLWGLFFYPFYILPPPSPPPPLHIPAFSFFKMCSLSAECFGHVSQQFAFFILPFVRYTKSLWRLGTVKSEENCNFLNNPLAGTSDPDDTRHMPRVINCGISDQSHLEATCIGPFRYLKADCTLPLSSWRSFWARFSAWMLFLCVWLGFAGWLAFSREYVSTVSSQFG